MRHRHVAVWFAAGATLGSGVINIYSVMAPALPHRMRLLEAFFPLEFIHIARFLTLLVGFALVISAINIYKRKRRAFHTVLFLSFLSIVFHMTKGLDYEEAIVSVLLVGILLAVQPQFTVKSSIPDLRTGVLRFAMAGILAIAYGVVGFWLLDRRQFGIHFELRDAVRETARYLTFMGDPALRPHTRFARWFLDSLSIMTGTAIVYSLYALFRPALYQLRTLPQERALARRIVETHGRSSLDFFKFWPDKSLFFSSSRQSFIAYRVGGHFAIGLGDPVGPENEIEGIVSDFIEMCNEHDWGVGFHQTLPDFLPVYEQLGLKKLKVGDEAIIDLGAFSLDGKERKTLRHNVHKLEESGIRYTWHEPPIPDEVLAKVKRVSDDWLQMAGRRERRFTLGAFDRAYLRSTPIAAASDSSGVTLAFVNQIPSYRRGEATIDLMRHRSEAPSGIMDYLLVKLFLELRGKGFTRFSLGMAPMSGFLERENPTVEEKAVHAFFQRLNFLFSYSGLKRHKAKFADTWEPRYAIYRSAYDLPRMALALRDVSELKGAKEPELDMIEEEERPFSETPIDEP